MCTIIIFLLHAIYSTSKEQLVERLYQASWHGNTGEVVDLLHKGADPNSLYYQRIHQGYTPLHRACGSNQSHTAELLIKWGARVNTINQDGETPLHYVSSLKCAELLLNEHCLRGKHMQMLGFVYYHSLVILKVYWS